MNRVHHNEGLKLLVIGLDGATFDVVRPMIAAGELPNLAALMQKGSSGYLESNISSICLQEAPNPYHHIGYHQLLGESTRWLRKNISIPFELWPDSKPSTTALPACLQVALQNTAG